MKFGSSFGNLAPNVRPRRDFLAGSAALIMAGSASAWGQDKGKDEEGPKIPEPENVPLETKDGVQLRCTFYPGTAKKKAIPIIMIHGWGGQRGEYHALALALQQRGNAVMLPDLRGHGESTRIKDASGEIRDIDPAKLRTDDLKKMLLDLEAVKKYLMKQNNAAELNIESLCVVGAGFGGILALNWSAADWNVKSLPSFKQGQDVKALILLSPLESFKGVTTRDALIHPIVKSRLSMLICVGKESPKELGDAKRIYNSLAKFHIKPPTDPEVAETKQDLFLVEDATSLQGTELLAKGLQTPQEIGKFINRRLIAKMDDFEWMERKNPLGND